MTGGFGDFFDKKTAEKNARDQETAKIEAEKQIARDAEIKRLSSPLRDKLEPTLKIAAADLRPKNVTIEPNPSVSMTHKSDYIYTFFFRLQIPYPHGGINFSDTYGFRVHENGYIEGVDVDKTTSGQGSPKRLFLLAPEKFGQSHVSEVIHLALTDLINGMP